MEATSLGADTVQGAERASHKLALLLQKHKWSDLARLLQLINLTVECQPAAALQLSAAGAASVVTGILHQYHLARPGLGDVLCMLSLELLLRLLRADARTLPYLSTLEVLSIVLQVLEPGSSHGVAARRTAAAIILHLAQHSRGCNALLLEAGAAHAMGGVLSDLPSLCDVDLVQEVLWVLCSLRLGPPALPSANNSSASGPELSRFSMDPLYRLSLFPTPAAAAAAAATPAALGPQLSLHRRSNLSSALSFPLKPSPSATLTPAALQPLSPVQLLPAIVPLLHAYRLPGPQYSGHLLALVIRAMHALLAGDADDDCKEVLRSCGVVEALVGLVRAEAEAEAAPRGLDEAEQVVGGSPPVPEPEGEEVTPWQRLLAALLLRPRSEHGPVDAAAPPPPASPSLLLSLALLLPLLRPTPSPLPPLDLAAPPTPLCARSLSPLPCPSTPPAAPAQGGPVVLSPVKEAVALLRALLSDSPSDQSLAVAAGIIPPLIQLVQSGDMEEAWVAAAALGGFRPAFGEQLMGSGAVEALAGLLQEAADGLHLMTVQRQLRGAQHERGAERGGGEGAERGLLAPAPVQPPLQHRAAQHGARSAERVHLVGRQNLLSFSSGSSSCMYSAGHGSASFCDLCIPSAALKALMRLLDPTAPGPGAAHKPPPASSDAPPDARAGEGDLVERFVSSGGIYTLFLLLHHEDVAGVIHSKFASSLISFLNQILVKRPSAQDEVRQVGGLPILTSVLQGLMRPGVTDIYQLRVSVCMLLKVLLQGNAANRIMAREHGLFTPLLDLLRLALRQPPANSGSRGASGAGPAAAAALATMSLLDAEEQVALAAMDTLSASLPGSSGNQAVLVSNGVAKLLFDVLAAEHYSPAVYAAALHLMAALCEGAEAVQKLALGSELLQHASALVDRTQSWSEVAGGYCALLLQLMRCVPQEAKGRILASGALRILLHTLKHRPAGRSTDTASLLLQMLVLNDVDLQIEVASRGGGLQSCFELITSWHGHITHSMLRLLSALALGNTLVKNVARGFLPLLLAVMRGCALSDPPTAILAAQALTTLVKSNHSSQSALAEQGGIETLAELIHVVVVSPVLAAADAGAQSSAPQSSEQLQQHPSMQWARRNPMFDRGSQDGSSSLSPGASMQLLSPGASMQLLSPGAPALSRSPAAAVSALFPAALAALADAAPGAEARLGALERAAERREMLEALLLLLGAAVEFHAANQRLVGESGCLAVLMHFLGCATSLPDHGLRLAQARLAPALSAGCSALSCLLQDCPENQLRLIEGSRVSVAEPGESLRLVLSKLLMISDPSITLEAARSLEYVTLGYDNSPELEEETVRALVKVLHSSSSSPVRQGHGSGSGSFSSGSGAGPGAGHATVPEPVLVSTVREASSLLQHVMQACNLVLAEAGGVAVEVPGLEAAPGAKGARKKPPPPVPAAAARKQQAPAPNSTAAPPAPAPPPPLLVQPLPALPASFSSPLRGDGGTSSPKTPTLASGSASLEGTADRSGSAPAAQQWQQVVGRSAPAFQAVAWSISDGPWKPCMLQISWLLFLLSVKSRANLELLGRLLRTTLLPLIQQLEHAEASHALLMHALELQQQQAAGGVGIREASRQLLGSSNSTGPLPVSTCAIESIASLKGAGARPAPLLLSPLGQGVSGSSTPSRIAGSDSPFARQNAALSPRALQQISDDARKGRWGVAATAGTTAGTAAAEVAGSGGDTSPLPPQSPASRHLTSDDDDWELAMIRQEVALMARTGNGAGAATTPR